MAFNKIGTMFPIASLKVLADVSEWNNFKKQAHVVTAEPEKTATEKKAVDKEADFQVVAAVDPEKFIYIHATIMAGVETEANGFWVTANTDKFINDNHDAWECVDLKNEYSSFRSATTFVEHDQNIERAKGKCVDAIARPMPDTVLIDVLFSVDRRHKDLVANIESGIINAVSMGCSTGETICTICGNKASDPANYCKHVTGTNKGRPFECSDGKIRRAAELCKNNKFFDISLVANPAFAGAIFRKILSSSEVSNHLLANILTSKIQGYVTESGDSILKAASKDSDEINIVLKKNGTVVVNVGENKLMVKEALTEIELENIKKSVKTTVTSVNQPEVKTEVENIMAKVFGEQKKSNVRPELVMDGSHPEQRSELQGDYKTDYQDYSPIHNAVDVNKKPDEPVEALFDEDLITEKVSRVQQFKCAGCGWTNDYWQIKAASIDAGSQEVLTCPKCGFIHEDLGVTKESTSLTSHDKTRLGELGFTLNDISALDTQQAHLIILKDVTKKEYQRDPNVTLRRAFKVSRDLPVDFDENSYWLNQQGKSIIAKDEILRFKHSTDNGKIKVFATREGEDVFIPKIAIKKKLAANDVEVKEYDLYQSNWNIWKSYSKKDAQEIKSFLEKHMYAGDKPDIKIKEDHGYIFGGPKNLERVQKEIPDLEILDKNASINSIKKTAEDEQQWTKEEYDKFDEKKLSAEIKKVFDINVENTLKKTGIVEHGRTVYGYFESTDVSGMAGIAKAMFKKLILKVTSVKLKDDSINFSVAYEYDHPGGGSNGFTLGTLWLMPNGEWKSRKN